MFEVLFTYPKVLARHRAGPAAAARERYLAHCAANGTAHGTLLRLARELLAIAERIDVASGESFSAQDVEAAAQGWVRDQRRRGRTNSGRWSRQLFIQVATAWLRFIGCFAALQGGTATIFSDQVADFAAHLYHERGLSPDTVQNRLWQIESFLQTVAAGKASIAQITIEDIDAFLSLKGQSGWCRVSVATSANALRSFFRHAERRGWCLPGMASAIDAPRIFKQEGLPRGSDWDEVHRLIDSTDGADPRNLRDRAILMLLAVYGLRSGEVRRLRLDDLDWTREVITIERPKQRRTQYYPLVMSVGDAILHYLQQARPPVRAASFL
jgi:integrase/recombinase XerD